STPAGRARAPVASEPSPAMAATAREWRKQRSWSGSRSPHGSGTARCSPCHSGASEFTGSSWSWSSASARPGTEAVRALDGELTVRPVPRVPPHHPDAPSCSRTTHHMDVKPLNPPASPRGQASPSPDGRPPVAASAPQPFVYPLRGEFREPDWTRIPGYRTASRADWESALWQRKHTVKNLRELKETLGDLLPETLLASIDRDQRERATMSILLPPQMINTMDLDDLWHCPVRRYMLPAFDDRRTDWPNHPRASRDSL